jgi:hypothetical protein
MQDNFFAMLLLLMTCVALAIFVFEYSMGKLLQVERGKWFSYNHVNELHGKIDWAIRIAFVIFIAAAFMYDGYTGKFIPLWPFEPWSVFFLFLVISESVRAYMEWKYAENPRTYLVTFSTMLFSLFIMLLFIRTGFFGLL